LAVFEPLRVLGQLGYRIGSAGNFAWVDLALAGRRVR
jgi:hypothetical protein